MESNTLTRRVLAEMVGTFILVVIGTGAILAALEMGNGSLDYPGLGFIAIAFAIAVMLAVYAFGATSGAHINPAVTVGLASTARFPWREVGPYILGQLVGASVATFLVAGMFAGQAVDRGLGATTPGGGAGIGQVVLVEAVGTFFLMLSVMAIAVDPRAPAGWAGLVIGLVVGGAILFMGPLTGGSMNPARTFGPLLGLAILGGTPDWASSWAYLVGPIAGAVIAAVTYDALVRPRLAAPATPPVPAP